MFILSNRSLGKLQGVHPDLIAVVKLAIKKTKVDFTVLEGWRDYKRQRKLVDAGASRIMRSRHLTGHAVDLGAYVAGRIAWDWPLYDQIYEAMHEAAEILGVDLVWGGDWNDDGRTEDETGLRDGPHFQLAWRSYPAKAPGM